MDEQLDDQLRKRISEVFDDIGEPSADEGWRKLQEIYPGRTKRRILPWMWWAAAAVLLLATGIALWQPIKNNPAAIVAANRIKGVEQHRPGKVNSQAPAVNNEAANTSKQQQPFGGGPEAREHQRAHTPPIILNTEKRKRVMASAMEATVASSKLQNQSAVLPAQGPGANSSAVKKGTTTQDDREQQLLVAGNQPEGKNADDTNKQNAVITRPDSDRKTMSSMFAADAGSKNPKLPHQRILQLGVFAATYYNYSKGSENKPNAGGGITADFRISKHLKIETGIMIAQNSLNFNTQIPTSTAQNNFAVPAATASFTTASVVRTASVPAFKNYDASLVSLDIPVNLKYEFNLHKNSIYFLAGLSSGTFTNETYEYRYNYPALLSPSLQQTQKQSSTERFNSFYFARMLNLGIGFGYPVGKNTIVIEPFLKYPLDGLGSQYIRFGAGGVNLKFNFELPRNAHH